MFDIDDAVDSAFALIEKGQVKKAESLLKKFLKRYPSDHLVLYGLGLCCAERHDSERAIDYMQQAITAYPYFPEAHYVLAILFQDGHDELNMVKAFRNVVISGEPDDDCVTKARHELDEFAQVIREEGWLNVETYVKAGDIFLKACEQMQQKQWQDAVLGFKQCLACSERHVQSHGNLGLCYLMMGDRDRAREEFDQALALDPDYEPALRSRELLDSDKSLPTNFIAGDYYRGKMLRAEGQTRGRQ